MKVIIPGSAIKTLQQTLDALEAKAERGGVPPKGAQQAAARGLELRRKFGRGGTAVGVARARDISNGKNLSESTVRRMKAYFDRHEVDKQGKDWDNQERPSNGKIAWLLWGGDAGRSWATRLVERWNREDGKTKSIPRWLPNGEEITELKQLAAVLCIDEKTAAYSVLDSLNPPEILLRKALVEVKGRNVRDSEYWGAPVGTPLPLPPKFNKPTPRSPKQSTTTPKEQVDERSQKVSQSLKRRADELAKDGKQTRAAVYELRSRKVGSGVRSYRKAESGTVSLPVKGETKTKAKYEPSDETSEILKRGGIDSPTFYELDASEAQFFHDSIKKAKDDNPHGAAVYVYDLDEYKEMRLFVSEDGGAGFAIKGGDELVSVFKGDSNAKRVAHPMVHLSIEEGARRGDAFDTVLPHIYGDHGLKTVARVSWNDEFSPEGWDKSMFEEFNDGEPDVIFMAYDEADTAGYVGGDGKMMDDYDTAYDFAKEKSKGGNEKKSLEQKERRVRTAAGARRFKQPIGSVIVDKPDVPTPSSSTPSPKPSRKPSLRKPQASVKPPLVSDRWRVAGTTDEITECDVCGKVELRGTVHMVSDEGELYAGSDCASKLAGRPVRTEAARADREKENEIRKRHREWADARHDMQMAASDEALTRLFGSPSKRSFRTMEVVHQDPIYREAVAAWMAENPEPESTWGKKDVYAGDRSGGISGGVPVPFETLKPVRRQTRDRIRRIIRKQKLSEDQSK